MPSLSEKSPLPEAQRFPTLETSKEVTSSAERLKPIRTSWSAFSKSQWLLILIALYAVGMMGFDAGMRMEDGLKHKGGKPRAGACPAQPKALGKGPGWVSVLVPVNM